MEGIDWTPVVRELVLLVAAILLVVKGPLAAYIKAAAERFVADRTQRELGILGTLAREAVHVAEMLGGTGAEKKTMAVNYIVRALGTHGLSFDEVEVGNAVEAALAYAKDVFYEPVSGAVK